MDQKQKSGLLPKWIYLTTLLKILLITFLFIKSTFYTKTYKTNYFYLAQFIMIILRLLCVKNICKTKIFVFITFSFAIDILISVLERKANIYRCVFEIVGSGFSMLWMTFLYPYYLLDNQKEKKL